MSTRISQGNFKSHVCTVKVSRMGLFADRGSVRSKTVRFSYINVLSLKNMVYSAQQIGIWQAAAGTACIVIASLWEVPLCLWLSKKVGIFVTVILNAGLGSVLGIFTATTSLWMICPYSWVPHLMISVLGILPNGEPVADQSTAMAFWMIILVLVISLAWFAALSFLTARWFEKKEVG